MTTGIMLVLSGILIGAGFALVWRDIRRTRRQAFLSEHEGPSVPEADVEIKIAHPATAKRASARGIAGVIGATRLFGRKSDQPREGFPELPAGAKEDMQQAVMAQWASLQPTIEAGVTRINGLLAQAHISIGDAGESAWSYKNHGYGVYRRLLLEEESVAWLRLELAPEGVLHARVKAHKDERSEINASSETAAEALDASRAGDLLADCLKPLAAYVAKIHGVAASPQESGQRAWAEVEGIIAAALTATNGALSQAGAKLVPLGPSAWDEQAKGQRLPLAIEVYGKDVARMHLDHRGAELEVAVGVPDAIFVNLGRRRRIAIAGLSVHPLAELMADCAWPVIARSREGRRSA